MAAQYFAVRGLCHDGMQVLNDHSTLYSQVGGCLRAGDSGLIVAGIARRRRFFSSICGHVRSKNRDRDG